MPLVTVLSWFVLNLLFKLLLEKQSPSSYCFWTDGNLHWKKNAQSWVHEAGILHNWEFFELTARENTISNGSVRECTKLKFTFILLKRNHTYRNCLQLQTTKDFFVEYFIIALFRIAGTWWSKIKLNWLETVVFLCLNSLESLHPLLPAPGAGCFHSCVLHLLLFYGGGLSATRLYIYFHLNWQS